MKPKVSILIPAFKPERSAMLKEALDSIHNQVFKDFEIIMTHYESRFNTGINHDKVNEMAKIAKGEFLVVLSDDDKLDPYFLDKTVAVAESQGLDIVYTDIKTFDLREEVWIANSYGLETFIHTTAPWMTSLIRKTVFDELGGWDKDQDYQDWDFYFRCFKAGKLAGRIAEPLFLYRLHKTNSSNSMDHTASREMMKRKHPEVNV